jgi:two-component system, chemotaxis family, protein-glutamate methylesterase/glutaminase
VRRDVVVIGGSAGALSALQRLVGRLPNDLPAAVLVATHLSPNAPSRLDAVLTKAATLPAAAAVDGSALVTGAICTAVPDRHLLIGADDTVRLTRGPRENHVRPAVDALFRAAARWCGPRVIGVVLSGSLDDGAAGLAAIAEAGGACLVQRPDDAAFDGMPRAALAAVPGATVGSATELARAITELAGEPVQAPADWPSDTLVWETDMAADAVSMLSEPGEPVNLACPECSGGMKVVHTGRTVHYLCHTGHSYSPQSFVAAREDGIEGALWTALSAMQEKRAVLCDLALRAEQAGNDEERRSRLAAAEEVEHASEVLRGYIVGKNGSRAGGR